MRAFRAEHAWPSTKLTREAFPDWHVDHFVPLCAYGADRSIKMQWLTADHK